jgi:SEC-C motif domain protein
MECCRPAHAGKRPPATPAELVRARYSAFALGLGAFLHETLGDAHADRAHGDAVAARIEELSRAGKTLKYMGVTLLESDEREALFLAKVFEKGQDRSFAELSSFERQDGTLRYTSGLLLPRTALPEAWSTLNRAAFRALAEGHPDLVVG